MFIAFIFVYRTKISSFVEYKKSSVEDYHLKEQFKEFIPRNTRILNACFRIKKSLKSKRSLPIVLSFKRSFLVIF